MKPGLEENSSPTLEAIVGRLGVAGILGVDDQRQMVAGGDINRMSCPFRSGTKWCCPVLPSGWCGYRG